MEKKEFWTRESNDMWGVIGQIKMRAGRGPPSGAAASKTAGKGRGPESNKRSTTNSGSNIKKQFTGRGNCPRTAPKRPFKTVDPNKRNVGGHM